MRLVAVVVAVGSAVAAFRARRLTTQTFRSDGLRLPNGRELAPRAVGLSARFREKSSASKYQRPHAGVFLGRVVCVSGTGLKSSD